MKHLRLPYFILSLALLCGWAAPTQAQERQKGSLRVRAGFDGALYLDAKQVKMLLAGDQRLIEGVDVGPHVLEMRGSDSQWQQVVQVQAGKLQEIASTPGPRKEPNHAMSESSGRPYKDPIVAMPEADKVIYREVVRLLELGEVDQAEAKVKPWLATKPTDVVPNYLMGRVWLDKADLQEDDGQQQASWAQAKAFFSQATSKSRPFNYALVGLAHVAARMRDLTELEALSVQARVLGVSDVNLMVDLANAWLRSASRQGLDEATTLLSQAEAVGAKNPKVLLTLGDAWVAQSVKDIPLEKYQKALELDPKYVRAHYRMGQYYVWVKKYNEGANALKKAIDLDANFAPAYVEMGELYFKAKQYPQAKDYYKQYVTLRRNDLWARYRYTLFLYLSKDYTNAVTEIRAVMKDTTSNVMTRLLAYCSYEQGDIKTARTSIDNYFASIKPEKTIPRDYEYLGKIEIKEGKLEQGIANIEKCLSLDPTRTDLYLEMAKIYTANKDFEKAIGVQQRALTQEPSASNYLTLSKLQGLNKNYEAADTCLARLCALRPDVLTGWLERARNAYNLDPETEKGTAQPYYDKVVELGLKDAEKNKNVLEEAYGYLAYYYYNAKKDNKTAQEYCEKALAINAENEKVKELKTHIDKVLKAGGK